MGVNTAENGRSGGGRIPAVSTESAEVIGRERGANFGV